MKKRFSHVQWEFIMLSSKLKRKANYGNLETELDFYYKWQSFTIAGSHSE